MNCTNCNAPISVEPTCPRTVKCGYCGVSILVPDDVWYRLHPANQSKHWNISSSHAEYHSPKHHMEKLAAFGPGVLDRKGNLYFVGSSNDDVLLLWCLDHELKLMWTHELTKNLLWDMDEYHLALATNDRLLFWTHGADAKSIRIFSTTDGAAKGTFSARTSSGPLSISKLWYIGAASDGTIVAHHDDRLLRLSVDGQQIDTWPTHASQARTPSDFPDVLPGKVHLGWDDSLFAFDKHHVSKFDRSGKLVYALDLPVTLTAEASSDAKGRLHFVSQDDGTQLARISADGHRIDILRGLLPRERYINATADDRLYLRDTNTNCRIFGAHGAMLYNSISIHVSQTHTRIQSNQVRSA